MTLRPWYPTYDTWVTARRCGWVSVSLFHASRRRISRMSGKNITCERPIILTASRMSLWSGSGIRLARCSIPPGSSCVGRCSRVTTFEACPALLTAGGKSESSPVHAPEFANINKSDLAEATVINPAYDCDTAPPRIPNGRTAIIELRGRLDETTCDQPENLLAVTEIVGCSPGCRDFEIQLMTMHLTH
jgi:hypothetical protein